MKYFVTILILLCALSLNAKVYNATDGSEATVSNYVYHVASVGDTVIVPPGTNSWTTNLTISGIQLLASATNQTFILCEVPIVSNGQGQDLITLNTTASALTRLSGFTILGGVTNNEGTFSNNFGEEIIVQGGYPFRIDSMLLTNLSGKLIKVQGDTFGVIDHCTFQTSNSISVEVYGLGYGDYDWSIPTQWGTSNAVYIENCDFSDSWKFGWVDVSAGGNCVMRYCRRNGCYFNTHGSETPGPYISARMVEFYNNVDTWGDQLNFHNNYADMDIRGGCALMCSNYASGYTTFSIIRDYRASDNNTGFAPWYGATGSGDGLGHLWDSNTFFMTVTAALTSATFTISNLPSMTTNQYRGYTLYDTNSTYCGDIVSNDTNTMTVNAAYNNAHTITFTKGNLYSMWIVYPMFTQPGFGQGARVTGLPTPTPFYTAQVSDPIYCWGNTNYQIQSGPVLISSDAYSLNYQIQVGRDIINTAKPGWKPFTYPHPLIAASQQQPPAYPYSVTIK